MEYLGCQKPKALFLPKEGSAALRALHKQAESLKIPCVLLEEQLCRNTVFKPEEGTRIRAFQTRHLDKSFWDVPHFCYLLEFGGKKLFFTADVDFTFIDLFAGIGGMRLAYESVGGHCVYSNEWNKYSQQTYFANFGEQPDGDITKVDESNIPDHDVLVAGFPCQPFSIAGVSKKQSLGRATGFEDKTQGTLFFDICRILRKKCPSLTRIPMPVFI